MANTIIDLNRLFGVDGLQIDYFPTDLYPETREPDVPLTEQEIFDLAYNEALGRAAAECAADPTAIRRAHEQAARPQGKKKRGWF